MEKVAYWIPIRTIAGTDKDKWLECSACGNLINMHDIEQLRFDYRNNPKVYENAIKTEYEMCSKCHSKMNTHITHELRTRNIAKGDRCLDDAVKSVIGKLNIDSLKKTLESCSCELRQTKL